MHQRQGSESSKRNTLPPPTSPGNLTENCFRILQLICGSYASVHLYMNI